MPALARKAGRAVGVLVALVYAAGQFSDEATCKQLVSSTISKMLAELLKQAPKVKAALEAALDLIPAPDGKTGKERLDDLINDAGTDDDPYGESSPDKVLAWLEEHPAKELAEA